MHYIDHELLLIHLLNDILKALSKATSYTSNYAYAGDYQARETEIWVTEDPSTLVNKVTFSRNPNYLLELKTTGKYKEKYSGYLYKEDIDFNEKQELDVNIYFALCEKPFKDPVEVNKNSLDVYGFIGKAKNFSLRFYEIEIKWKQISGRTTYTFSFYNDPQKVLLIYSPILVQGKNLKLLITQDQNNITG